MALRYFGHGDTQTSDSSNSSNSGSTGSFGSGISSASSDRNSHDYPLGEAGTDNTGVSESELNENGLIDISGGRALSGSSDGGDLTVTEILLLEEWEIQFIYYIFVEVINYSSWRWLEVYRYILLRFWMLVVNILLTVTRILGFGPWLTCVEGCLRVCCSYCGLVLFVHASVILFER